MNHKSLETSIILARATVRHRELHLKQSKASDDYPNLCKCFINFFFRYFINVVFIVVILGVMFHHLPVRILLFAFTSRRKRAIYLRFTPSFLLLFSTLAWTTVEPKSWNTMSQLHNFVQSLLYSRRTLSIVITALNFANILNLSRNYIL